MDVELLIAERDRVSATLRAIRTGAAEISQLLAEEVLSGEEWEQAVRVLAECRAERKRLDDRLLHIDASIDLLRRNLSGMESGREGRSSISSLKIADALYCEAPAATSGRADRDRIKHLCPTER